MLLPTIRDLPIPMHIFYFRTGKKTEALALLEKTIKKFPDHLSSLFLLGNIYLENGNKGKAIELYTKTLNSVRQNEQLMGQIQSEIERIKKL